MEGEKQPAVHQAQHGDVQSCREKKRKPVKAVPDGEYGVVDAYGNYQENSRFHDNIPGVPGEWHLPVEGNQIQESQKDLADQHAPQVGFNAEPGNAEEDKSQS